jgi:hypothetical protein
VSDAQRKRAFVVVGVVVAAAVAALSMLPQDESAKRSPGGRKVVVESHSRGGTPRSPASEQVPVLSARTIARRFAVAYLARDSGLDSAGTWRAFRATTTAALWETLREPVRIPPSVHPGRARLIQVNGVSETAPPGDVAATVEYRRVGERRYLRFVLVNQTGVWRVTSLSP